LVSEMQDYGIKVDIHDPWADPAEAQKEYGLNLISTPEADSYDGIILAVAHDDFVRLGADTLRGYGVLGAVIYDLKNVFSVRESNLRL